MEKCGNKSWPIFSIGGVGGSTNGEDAVDDAVVLGLEKERSK